MGNNETRVRRNNRLPAGGRGRAVRRHPRTSRTFTGPGLRPHSPGEHRVSVQSPLPPLPPRGRPGQERDHVPGDDGGDRLVRPAVSVPGHRYHRRGARAGARPSFSRRRACPACASFDASNEPFRLERRRVGVVSRALHRPPRGPGRLLPLDESVPGRCPAWRGRDGNRDRRAEEVERSGVWSGRDRVGTGPRLQPGRGVPSRFPGVRRTEIPKRPAAEMGGRVQPPVHVRECTAGAFPDVAAADGELRAVHENAHGRLQPLRGGRAHVPDAPLRLVGRVPVRLRFQPRRRTARTETGRSTFRTSANSLRPAPRSR